MKIFLDFDDVIFNTAKFKQDYSEIFYLVGISRQELKNEYYTSKNGPNGLIKTHDPMALLERLEKKKNISYEKVKSDIKDFLVDTRSYVFKDFYPFAEEFTKDNLGLISFGDISFQTEKIKGSQIASFFSIIEITDQHKGKVLKNLLKKQELKNERLVFIDDRPDKLLQVKEIVPSAILIRLNRRAGRYYELPTPFGIPASDDLYQVKALIDEMGA